MNKDEFLQSEKASRDTLDVKRIYIDIAGDLVTGIILSQIIYWHLTDRNGRERLRVEHDGFQWLAKTREDWWDECRVTPRQVDRAIGILVKKSLVVKDVFKFNNSPTLHVRLNWGIWLATYEAALSGVRLKSPTSEIEIDEDATSLTETTPENTTEKDGDAEKTASPVVGKPSVLVDGKPEYVVGGETPDTAARNTTPAVPNGDGNDPEGLFTGARAEMPDYKASAAAVKTSTRAAIAVFGQNTADVANSEWQEVREPDKRRILHKFSELFGIMPPKPKSMRGQWLYGVNELLAVTGGDAAEVLRLMDIFADKRRAGANGYQFDILGPKSLANKMHILYSQAIMGETRAGDSNVIRIAEVGGTGGLVSGSTGQDIVRINSIGAVR